MSPSPFAKLMRLFDKFVDDSYKENIDMLFKARLLVGFILIIITSIISLLPLFITVQALSTDIMHLYFYFAPPVVLFFLGLLYLVKTGQHYQLVAYAVVLTGAGALFAGLLVTGGPARTGLIHLLVLAVVLAFLMLGFRAGIITSALVAAGNVLLFILHYAGFEFINVTPEESRPALHIFHWLYTFAIMTLLVAIYESMASRLKKERDAERKRYQYMASHDGLTGLSNRKCYDEMLSSVLALAGRNNSTVAIGMLDLDGFKPINDTIGHEAGDAVLQIVAKRMQNALRKSDRVARLGGDEFGFIITNIKTRADIEKVCNKLLDTIAEPIDYRNQQLRVTGSLGIAVYPEDGVDEHKLRSYADHAMYYAKRNNSGWHMHQGTDNDASASQ